MKAYIVGLESDPDVGNGIVFANNSKEARKLAMNLELTDTQESYIDVYVRRYESFDNMENSLQVELDLLKWHEGWYFFQDNCPNPDIATDDEFRTWWKITMN